MASLNNNKKRERQWCSGPTFVTLGLDWDLGIGFSFDCDLTNPELTGRFIYKDLTNPGLTGKFIYIDLTNPGLTGKFIYIDLTNPGLPHAKKYQNPSNLFYCGTNLKRNQFNRGVGSIILFYFAPSLIFPNIAPGINYRGDTSSLSQ